MSFLAPLFLLGGLAVAAPVIFHLVRRTSRERVPFGSLMFLRPSPPRIDRRSRIEHLFLLLLRALALLLLAAGFSRPFWKDIAPAAEPPSVPRITVVLVDTSASMRRPGVWDAARAAVGRELRREDPGRVAVVTFDRSTAVVLGFDEWGQAAPGARLDLVAARLSAVAPGWAGTDLGGALVMAADLMAEAAEDAASAERRIVLVSDLQEGTRTDRLQTHEWHPALRVIPVPVAAPAGNAGVQVLAAAADAPGTETPAVRLRLVNSPDATTERLSVGWLGPAGDVPVGPVVDAYVPPGQSRVVALPVPEAVGGAIPTRIRLSGDAAPFDNVVHVVPPAPARSTVLYLGREAAGDARQPRYFLARALPAAGRQAVDLVAPDPAGAPDPALLAESAVGVVSTVLDDRWIAALRGRLASGGMVVVLLREPSMGATLGALLGTAPLPVEEAAAGGHALLGELDFRHPLLVPFADPRYSDFTRVHFWRHRRIDPAAMPDARVVARFDGGDPAWIDVPVGPGRVVVMTSGWHPEDSQLALSTRFVPLMISLLELGGGWQAPLPDQFEVGDAVPVARFTGGVGEPVRIRLPDGTAVEDPTGVAPFDATRVPGVYRIESVRATNRFVVNVPAVESRTAGVAGDQLEALGVPLGDGTGVPSAAVEARREARAAAATEGRQKLWRWFLAATVLVLLVETAAAAVAARRTTTVMEVTP